MAPLTAKPIPQDIRDEMYEAYNFYCGVPGCLCKYDGDDTVFEIHHRNENSKSNNKKFPLLMQSPFMLILICRSHHEDGKVLKLLKYTEKQMIMMEKFLQGLKDA